MTTQTGVFSLNTGPHVRVRIQITRAEVRLRRSAGQAIPQPAELSALIDTGAECSCVDVALARRLGLPAYKFQLANAPGIAVAGFVAQLEATVSVLHPSDGPAGELILPSIPVVELDLDGTGYSFLIGRDILARCEFTYNGRTDSFTLSY